LAQALSDDTMQIDEETTSAKAVAADAKDINAVGVGVASATLEEKREEEEELEEKAQGGEQATLADVLSAVVFENLPDRLKSGDQKAVKLQIDEAAVRKHKGIDLRLMIGAAYGSQGVSAADAQKAIAAAEVELKTFMARLPSAKATAASTLIGHKRSRRDHFLG